MNSGSIFLEIHVDDILLIGSEFDDISKANNYLKTHYVHELDVTSMRNHL